MFDGSDWMTIPREIPLVHIDSEAGDEEVWAVNATNHIRFLKHPVDHDGSEECLGNSGAVTPSITTDWYLLI